MSEDACWRCGSLLHHRRDCPPDTNIAEDSAAQIKKESMNEHRIGRPKPMAEREKWQQKLTIKKENPLPVIIVLCYNITLYYALVINCVYIIIQVDFLAKWFNHLMGYLTDIEYDLNEILDMVRPAQQQLIHLEELRKQLKEKLQEIRDAVAYSSKVSQSKN